MGSWMEGNTRDLGRRTGLCRDKEEAMKEGRMSRIKPGG